MAKEENKTKQKIDKLKSVLGDFSYDEEKVIQSQPVDRMNKKSFRTSEVVVLLLITLVTSLLMGGFFSYRLLVSNSEKLDIELKEFIKNYDYITDNYNGNVNKKELIDAAIEGMLKKLDKNSTYLDSEFSNNFDAILNGSYSGLGVQIYEENGKIVIENVFEQSPAAKSGLKSGDIIKKVNGKSIDGLTSEEVSKLIRKSKNNNITIGYERDGEEKTVKVKTGKVNIKSVDSKIYDIDSKKIGYINIGIFASNSYKQFKSELKKAEAKKIDSLIIDLRGNSGGYLSVSEDIISLFLDKSHVIYQIKKDDVVTKHYSKGLGIRKYKIIILVDGDSASASEILASALQEQYGAILVGTKTYGKGTVQELQDLTDGNKYKLTTKNWLTSKGLWVDGKGIEPNIYVELSEDYLNDPTDANDNQLQTALNELK